MVIRKVHVKNINVSSPKFEFDLKQICGKSHISVIKDTYTVSIEDDSLIIKLIALKELYKEQEQTIILTIVNL